MKLKFLIILNLLLCISHMAQSQNAGTPLHRFVNSPALETASVSISIKDMSGKNIVSYNENKSLTPASVLKVLTTATAIETLGANYKYATKLSRLGDTIFVHGSGDPSLGSEQMSQDPNAFLATWTNEISKIFGKDKAINIRVIDNLFGYSGISRKWIREDVGNYYAAGAYGISVFDNTYRLTLNSMIANVAPSIVNTEPNMPHLKFDNQLTQNTSGRDNAYIIGDPASNNYTLTGNIPAARSKFTIKGSIPNPGLYMGETLAKSFKELGYKMGKILNSEEHYKENMLRKSPTAINSGKVFYTHYSASLTEIIREVNVKSNNHYTEHLIRTIGRKHNANIYSSALGEGIDYINQFWKNRGINTKSLIIYDGCGLSPANGISAGMLTDVLVYMKSKAVNGDAFFKSLPIAGQEGTVSYFLRNTKLAGKVHVKSGSIADVQCFSGYYIDGDKKYAFTILVNKYNGTRAQTMKAITQFLTEVF